MPSGLELAFQAGRNARENSSTYQNLPDWLKDTGPYGQNNNSTAQDMVDLNEDNWLDALMSRARSGDEAALDKAFDYFATRQSEKTARDWTAIREDSAYQRLVKDLEKAGISPYILSGATPFASAANSHTLSGSQFTSEASSKRSKESADNNITFNIVKTILTLVGTAATIALFL